MHRACIRHSSEASAFCSRRTWAASQDPYASFLQFSKAFHAKGLCKPRVLLSKSLPLFGFEDIKGHSRAVLPAVDCTLYCSWHMASPGTSPELSALANRADKLVAWKGKAHRDEHRASLPLVTLHPFGQACCSCWNSLTQVPMVCAVADSLG